MTDGRKPHQIVADFVAARADRGDGDVLSELASLPALADECDECWDSRDYWHQIAYVYLALADVAAARRLRPAIGLLLERASYGDPGGIMGGLRHRLETIADGDRSLLADVCLETSRSGRPGTRLWAIDELMVLADSRATPIFEEAARSDDEEIRWRAEAGLKRLAS